MIQRTFTACLKCLAERCRREETPSCVVVLDTDTGKFYGATCKRPWQDMVCEEEVRE